MNAGSYYETYSANDRAHDSKNLARRQIAAQKNQAATGQLLTALSLAISQRGINLTAGTPKITVAPEPTDYTPYLLLAGGAIVLFLFLK